MENFVRMFMILAEVAVGVIRAFLEDKIQPDNFETFLRKHKHDFYHLCYNRGRCCSCGLSPTFPPQAILRKAQLDLLFVQHPGANCLSRFCCCSYIATPNIQLETIDITLCCAIINNFVTLDKFQNDFLNDIRIVRNEISHFAHQHDISSVEFERMWKKVTKASIHLATCIKTSNTYSVDIQDQIERLRNRPILAIEYTECLREIVKWINGNEEHRMDMDEKLKRIEKKIDEIPDVLLNLFLKFQQTSNEHDGDLPHTTETQPKIIEETMGTNESKTAIEGDEMIILKEKIEKEGPATTRSYIEENINRWKSEKIQFGVCGYIGTGKSYFINTVRGVKMGDSCYALVGWGDTTMEPIAYAHPENPRIVYNVLPSVGTLMMKKESYINDMRICDYDFVFIFLDRVMTEENVWLAGELDKLGKPFCFVRSKLDQDIKNAERANMDKESVMYEIRKKITISMKKNAKLEKSKNAFFISCVDPSVGEMHELLSYVESNLDKFKCEAFVLSLPVLSEGVIDLKYQILQRKIKMVSFASALISDNPVPGVDVVANIAILVFHLVHYIDSFGLSNTRMQELKTFDRSVLKCNNILLPGADMAAFVVTKLGFFATKMVSENIFVILPVIGSIISGATSAAITYKFLNDILKDIRHDAIIVYDHIKEQNSDIRL